MTAGFELSDFPRIQIAKRGAQHELPDESFAPAMELTAYAPLCQRQRGRDGQVGSATGGDIRAAGGIVKPTPTASWPNHCSVSGLTAGALSELFTPTVANPCR